MEIQIQRATADASLPQYCLNAICHLAASIPTCGPYSHAYLLKYEALPLGATKTWWAESAE